MNRLSLASTRVDTVFPYTTHFRSKGVRKEVGGRLGPWLDGSVVPDPFGVLHVGDSRWKADHSARWAVAGRSPHLQHDPPASHVAAQAERDRKSTSLNSSH